MRELQNNPDFDVVASVGNGTVQSALSGEAKVMPWNHIENDPRYPGNTAASTTSEGW